MKRLLSNEIYGNWNTLLLTNDIYGEIDYSNPACDRFMAVLGAWADVGPFMRWPYRAVPEELAEKIRPEARKLIPEFFEEGKS